MEKLNPQSVQQFSRLELKARQVVEGFITGLHKSPFHGFSVEFAEHRLYNKGESTKHIDWKLYGRTDRLFVKRFEEETNLRCQIIIDDSSSMYFPIADEKNKVLQNKITFSVFAAAALIELLKRQRDAVGLSIFSNQLDVHLPARSSPLHHKTLYGELEKLISVYDVDGLHKTTSAAKTLHQIAETIHKRSLVILFSDMFDSNEDTENLFAALQHLKHNKHEMILFHVTDKSKEIDFEFENRPYRFVDMETGERIKVNPNEVKKQYIESMSNFYKNLKLKCNQYKIEFVEADISKGYDQVLLHYLLKRTRML